MKEFLLSSVLLFHLYGNEEINQLCYCEVFGIFSIELNCIYLSLLQPFCHLWQIIFLEFVIRRWLVSYVTPLQCCTCIPITDILPLGKESLDFKKQRETNDRALSRTLQLLDTNQGLHFLPSTAAGKHQLSSSEEIYFRKNPQSQSQLPTGHSGGRDTGLVGKAGGRCKLFINSVIWMPY